MEYLLHLLKRATLVEWGLIAVAIVFGLVLAIVGIFLFFRAKRKAAVALFVGFTIFPLLFCLSAIGVRWVSNQSLYRMNELQPGDPYYEKYVSEDRMDYIVAGLIGVLTSAPAFMIGTAGLIRKRPS